MDKYWSKDYPSAEYLTEEGLDENHSLRKMFYLLGDNQQVVDFGCASGYFAQLLKKKGCIVTGVDINPDAAKVAKQYCKEVIVADLDFVSVTEILPSNEFDVAVFGDVLEHLRNPWKVLEETKQILKKDGYIVASIPNIAHGAIRLALLQGRFEYTELGILDNTHLKFFTRKTVEELFERAGYFLDIADLTKLEIFSESSLIPQNNKNEFNNDTIKELEKDEDAETLQFIIKAYPQTIETKYAAINERYYKQKEESQQLLQSQIHSTQAELKQTQAQVQDLQLQLQQLQSDLQSTNLELARSQSQLQQTQTELEQSQSQLQQTQTELEQSQSQMQKNQAELEKSQSQMQKNQTELEKSHSQVQKNQTELEQSQFQLQQSQAELKDLQLQFQQMKALLQETQDEVEAMQTSKFWKLRTQWFKVKKFFNLLNTTKVESEPTFPRELHDVFSNLSNQDWLKVILQSVSNPIVNGVELPGFPSDEIQMCSVGSTAKHNLHEAFNFYCIIKGYLSSFGQPLSSNSRVLDFGCGWGRIIRFFLKDVPINNVYGVDVDEEMINLCRETVKYGKYNVVNSSPPSNLPSDSFDLIYAYSVFSHLNEETCTGWIEEFSRILKPNGLLIVTTRSKSHLDLCRSLRDQGNHKDSHALALANSFVDYDAASNAYDNGKFLHEATGGGVSRPASFYGETLIPCGYVERQWTRFLIFRDFIYDSAVIPQAIIVMQKASQNSI